MEQPLITHLHRRVSLVLLVVSPETKLLLPQPRLRLGLHRAVAQELVLVARLGAPPPAAPQVVELWACQVELTGR